MRTIRIPRRQVSNAKHHLEKIAEISRDEKQQEPRISLCNWPKDKVAASLLQHRKMLLIRLSIVPNKSKYDEKKKNVA